MPAVLRPLTAKPPPLDREVATSTKPFTGPLSSEHRTCTKRGGSHTKGVAGVVKGVMLHTKVAHGADSLPSFSFVSHL